MAVLADAIKELTKEVQGLPSKVEIAVETRILSYDNGALSLPERAVRALESIADSLSRLT